ncbi:MAG: hypothetical protein ACPG31_06110 [Planctomycetota bacterium]
MDRKERRRREAELATKKEKKRLVLAGVGLALCAIVLVQLKLWGDSAQEEESGPTQSSTAYLDFMPEIDFALLASVKDATDSDRTTYERDAFEHLLASARKLITNWLLILGEPEFPFAAAAADASPYRGKPYRLRAKLINARFITLGHGEDELFWCHAETDAGDSFWFVAANPPDTLFGAENYVLADGYFFKHYTYSLQGEDKITAPMFIGPLLAPSFRAAEPATEPSFEYLATLKDHPLGTDTDTLLLNQDPGLWHLANVARTVRQDPALVEAAKANAITIDDKTIEDLVANPGIFRGRMFEFGGKVVRASMVDIPETPLRETRMSSAWVRNDFVGDFLMHAKAPGEFELKVSEGPVIYYGYFLMLWGYDSKDEGPMRTPVFVVIDAQPQEAYTPPFAGQMVVIFLALALALGFWLFILAKRDRAASDASMKKLTERRQARRNQS